MTQLAHNIRRMLELETEAKNQAYAERNRILQLLTKLQPAHLRRHEPLNDPNWDPAWRWVVCVHPHGAKQMTWHIHDSQLVWFDHLYRHPDPGRVFVLGMAGSRHFNNYTVCEGWDGHTTGEKHARIQGFPTLFNVNDLDRT